MKPKTIKIMYWVATVPFILFMAFAGYSELFPNQMGIDLMKHLGYPLYFLYLLGISKLLGVIAISYGRFKTLKEWAYAGFAIDLISASASFAFLGDSLFSVIFPLIVLGVMFASYYFWKRMDTLSSRKTT